MIINGYIHKQYYEKKKLKCSLKKKNLNIAKKIIEKYEKFWSQNYIKFHNSKAIEAIVNKLDKNYVKKQLEAKEIVLIFETVISEICIKY